MTVRGSSRAAILFLCGALFLTAACVTARSARSATPPASQTPFAASWARRAGEGLQPGRIGASVVYDAPRNRLLLFGGANGPYLNDTWAFDLAGQLWTQLTTTGTVPTPRQYHTATLDPAGRMIVYGGYDGRILNDAYRLDLATLTWTKITISSKSPVSSPYRYEHAAAMLVDARDTSLYIFGGTDGDSLQSTVLRLVLGSKDATRNNTWRFAPPASTTRPPLRRLAAGMGVLVTPTDTSLIVMGGTDGIHYLNDVWAFNLTTADWDSTRAASAPKPNPRAGHAAAIDQATQTLYIFGGWNGRDRYSDAWSLSLATRPATWVARDSTQPGPEGRSFAGAALTPGGLAVVSGGGKAGALNDAWLLPLSGGSWANLTPVLSPDPRYGHVSLWDPRRAHGVIFGGSSSYNQDLNDMWTYDPPAQAWSRVVYAEPAFSDSTVPYPRTRASAVLVPGATAADDTIYVFGGRSRDETDVSHPWSIGWWAREMFAYSPESAVWRRVIPADSVHVPSFREDATLVYDAPRNRLVLFGGFDGSVENDTWAFDFTTRTWSALASAAGGRYGHVAATDASGQFLVVAGGATASGSLLRDVQTFDLAANAWAAVTVTGTRPAPRLWPASFVDPASNSLIIFGGAGPTSDPRLPQLLPVAYGDSIFALDLGTYEWRLVGAGFPVEPNARFLSGALYVPDASPSVVLFGGASRSTFNDTWTLSFTGGLEPLAEAHAETDGSVMVRWRAPAAGVPSAGYSVLRARVFAGVPGPEAVVTSAPSGASSDDGWIEAKDASVPPGATYAYTVLDLASGYRVPAGTVVIAASATAPRLGFELRSPAIVPVGVTLTLSPGESAASSDGDVSAGIFDVSGRKLTTLPLTASQGVYGATWDGRDVRGVPASSGIYWMRIVSGSPAAQRVTPARFVLVR